MKCPRCESTVLDERERDGVVIDVCRQCRGVWLDRGELEKLIAKATAEYDEIERRAPPLPPPPAPDPRPDPRLDPRDDPYYRRRHDSSGEYRVHHGGHSAGYPRKRRWLDSIGDLFD